MTVCITSIEATFMQVSLTVSAGISAFENPTLVHRHNAINLNELFVHSPPSMQLIGSPVSYRSVGISKGDWLLVDAALQPVLSDLVLVEDHDGHYIVSYRKLKTQLSDEAADPLLMLGVITLSIHHYRQPKPVPIHESLADFSLHSFLVERELSTIFCRARGDSMLPFIHNSDIMILERHLTPVSGDVAVLALNHDLVCKRIDLERRLLLSDNPSFKTHKVDANSDYLRMHGVVRYTMRLHRGISPC